MKGTCIATVTVKLAYDVEIDAGGQVNVLEFYGLEPGTKIPEYHPLSSLPRDVRLQLVNAIVAEAREKDRMYADAEELLK